MQIFVIHKSRFQLYFFLYSFFKMPQRFKIVRIDETTTEINPAATHVKVYNGSIILPHIFVTCPHIRKLQLYGVMDVPDCSHTCVEELVIQNCPLRNAFKIGTSMREVYIESSHLLSELFADSVKNLQILTVKHCTGLLQCFNTDVPVNLKELKLIKNTNMCLTHVPASVTELTIVYCDNIISVPLCENLHRIRLAGFPLISALSLMQCARLLAIHLHGFALLEHVYFPETVRGIRINVALLPDVCTIEPATIDSQTWDLGVSDV